MTTLTSDRPQHMVALDRANEMRSARAKLKRRVITGDTTASAVIEGCPWEAASMSIAELLECQNRWGPLRSSKLLARVGLPETKTVGSLTMRQRGVLAGQLA